MVSGPELPTGTVTFLFSDIEGSTRLLKRLRYAGGWHRRAPRCGRLTFVAGSSVRCKRFVAIGACIDQLWVR